MHAPVAELNLKLNSNLKLKLKTQEIDLKELISIFDPNGKSKLIPQAGTINCDLELRNKDLIGTIILNNLECRMSAEQSLGPFIEHSR